MRISTATVETAVFTLMENCGRYRWMWPDGSPTELTTDSIADARRAMAFRGMGLASEWKLANLLPASAWRALVTATTQP